MDHIAHICFAVLETLPLLILASKIERFAIYDGTSNFNGLSVNLGDISNGRCAIRYELFIITQFGFLNVFLVYFLRCTCGALRTKLTMCSRLCTTFVTHNVLVIIIEFWKMTGPVKP